MSAGCLRWLLSRAVSAVCVGGPASGSPASRLLVYGESYNNKAPSWRWSLFSTTTGGDSGESPALKKNPHARAAVGAVGRKIAHRILRVISDTGENLGTMHRADALRLMEEKGLKLVVLSENSDPPVYRLMSGKQIHEEQTKQREKQKDTARQVQVKELTLSSDIAAHDLKTKLKQVQSWLEKKHHVRLTLRSRRGGISQSLDTSLEQIVQQIEATVGFVSKPKVIRDGQAAACVLRPPSKKELSQQAQTTASSSSQPTNTSLDSSTQPSEPTNTSLDSSTQPSEPTNTSADSSTQPSEPTNTSLDSSTQPSEPTNTSLDSSTQPSEPINTSADSSTQPSEPTNTSLDSSTQPSEPTNTSADSPTQPSEPTTTSADSPTDKTKDSLQQ